MPDYRWFRVPVGTYFFTVNLLERRLDTLVRHVDVLQSAVRATRQERPFYIDAWVVLPDHLHCIWSLPEGDADYPTRWRLIKLLFAKGLPKHERLSVVRRQRKERGIWHRRYWEHTIRNERDLENHVNYIHANPVKQGWVTKPVNWPYSTISSLCAFRLIAC